VTGGLRGREADAVAAVERLGLANLGVLGSGIEGVVLAIDADTVAKVWTRRSYDDLVRLRRFWDSTTEALAALAAVPGAPDLRALPVLPAEPTLHRVLLRHRPLRRPLRLVHGDA
jgi:hypothetical protein